MRSSNRNGLLVLLALAACETPQEPAPAAPAPLFAAGSQVIGHANGDGMFPVAGVVASFSMSTQLRADGSATGQAFHTVILGGLLIEFRTRVTCAAIDPATNRAWIGGVITANNSAHPSFTAARNQVGRDIWFRLVDYGNGGSGIADRTTFVGFEGDAGIATSAEYCEARVWPGPPTDVVDARTNPLSVGNISVILR
jgi:hypothetical protein